MLPPVSLPMAKATKPAAVAAPGPALDDGRVAFRNAVAKGFRAVGGRDACGVEQIFRTPRNAVQRPAILSGSNLLVGLLGLFQRMFLGQRDHAAELRIVLFQSCEIDGRQPLRGELPGLNPARKLGDVSKCDVFVVYRKWAGIGIAADEFATRRQLLGSWKHRIPA